MTDEQMLQVYRHDAHKMRGQSHRGAPSELAGVPVNADVPYGADSDAAAMSRPNGEPEETLHGHETHYRRSLITGDTAYNPETFALSDYERELNELLATGDGETMHKMWLGSNVVAAFNESVYYPYTSLKYHTLLVGALVANYRDGNEFADLALWLADGSADILPFKTVFATEGGDITRPFKLWIDITDKGSERAAKISGYPFRNFSSVWSRLPTHPINHEDKTHRVIDSQLRRINSWSTALQYLEDVIRRGDVA